MKRKPIKPWLGTAYRGLLRLHLRSYENYQPVYGVAGAPEGSRDCERRWRAMEPHLKSLDCRSLVDLGCSEGYYVIQAARAGLGFCTGVDFDLRRMWTCYSQVLLNDLPGASFLLSEITPQLIDDMPAFDAVIFLSVLHHLMYQHGEGHCRDLLARLRPKVGKVLFFEMGQSDEHLESWASKLPDMGSDPHGWIADFLRSAGFREMEKITTTTSYRKEVERALFAVRP